ncbi:FtsX-like permease family protein [Sneathiella sp. P13V-1]|nr:FtsX-like permease family protein [Sneathiella sp. P13V-1]
MLRDLWRIKGQAVAIGLVIALGVLLLVMEDGLVNSLENTKETYYSRYRLADIFAPVKRAPLHTLDDIELIEGVASVEGRITGIARIDLPGSASSLHGTTISMPENRQSKLNNIYLSGGRYLDPTRPDEVILLEGFAVAHNLSPGDTLSATMNGSRRVFEIVGTAQSPEFLYSAPPGEMMPDDARFAVLWMNEKTLQAAYDLEGAYNEAIVSLTRGAKSEAVEDKIDLILDPYGSTGAYGLEDHVSNRFIQEEIDGQRVTSRAVPPVFLAVAAFLLNIVITRMIESEREQIGLLKAFGYSGYEIGAHYFKFILIIATGGALLGCVLGVLAGRSFVGIFQIYYKFPFLVFTVDPKAFIIGIAVSVLAASAGGVLVLRRVFNLTPAVAMRPPAPADYSRSAKLGTLTKKILDQPSRMVVRRIIRQPLRAFLAILGIAAGMSLSVGMLGIMSGFNHTVDVTFNVIDRSQVNVTLVEPLSDKVAYELAQIPGVTMVEPYRVVSATFRNGPHYHRGAINGLEANPELNRVIDKNQQPIFIREKGIILAKALAEKLDIVPGEILTVDIREGRRPTVEIPVAAIADTLLGSPAFMETESLNRLLKEPGRMNGAYLRIDEKQSDQIYQQLKEMPAVAGVSLKEQARAAFQKIIDSGAGAMRYVMALIAGTITFGIVYNSARIAFAERSRDLASLRVIGFTRAEATFVLLGELSIITVLALPLGAMFGNYLAKAIAIGFSTDLYQVPATVGPTSYGTAIMAVVIAAILSGWLVKRDIDTLDLVSALKTRE